jgi:CheY-like chemotaxis protein
MNGRRRVQSAALKEDRMPLRSFLADGVMDPRDFNTVKQVFDRIRDGGWLPDSLEEQQEFGAHIFRAYFRGVTDQHDLYHLGLATAKLRYRKRSVEGAKDGGAEMRVLPSKVFVVEDDEPLAQKERMIFERAGAMVIGPAHTEEEAFEFLETNLPDLAVLDLNLGQGVRFQVAEYARDHAIPICIISGCGQQDVPRLPTSLKSAPWLMKPFSEGQLLMTAAGALPN